MANSDHCIIQWHYRINMKIQEEVGEKFNFHKGRYDKICEELQQVDWGQEFEGKDVEYMWGLLLAKVYKCRDKYVPKSKKRTEKHPMWMGASIKKKIKNRGREWKKFKARPTMEGELRYKQLRNSVIKEIRDAKRVQEFKLAQKIREDPKSFYSYVRSKTKVKVKVGPLMKDGKMISDTEGMSKVLNEYFGTVFTKEDMRNMPKRCDTGNRVQLEQIVVTEEQVTQAIKVLQETKRLVWMG
jgi:hypothetical protein